MKGRKLSELEKNEIKHLEEKIRVYENAIKFKFNLSENGKELDLTQKIKRYKDIIQLIIGG